ncbi:unnamed protein product [Discula destructiva]
MRSFGPVLSVSVLFMQQVCSAALPPVFDELGTAAKDAFCADNVKGFVESVEEGIPSAVPLEAFGDFMAEPLEEMKKHPDLLDHPTNPAYAPQSDISESKFTAPNIMATTSAAPSCTSPGTRIEWRNYPDADRHAFVGAISCLLNTPSNGSQYAPSASRYEDFVQVHQAMTHAVHGNGIFLFWHRLFVHTFEQELRTKCNFKSALPWWDETKDSGRL